MNGFPNFLLSLVVILLYVCLAAAWIIQSIRVMEGYSKVNVGYYSLNCMMFICTAFVVVQLYYGVS